jgi:hypothetical protein
MRLPGVAAAGLQAARVPMQVSACAVLFAAGVLSGGCGNQNKSAEKGRPFKTTIIDESGKKFTAFVDTTENSFGEPKALILGGSCSTGKIAFRIPINATSGSESVTSTIGEAQAVVENTPDRTHVTVHCLGTPESATISFDKAEIMRVVAPQATVKITTAETSAQASTASTATTTITPTATSP